MSLDCSLHAFDPAVASAAADRAARQIPPLWPLASHVAVNPFLGQTGAGLAETGARLARVGAVPVVMPRAWYRARIASGAITDDDLAAALAASPHAAKPCDLAALTARLDDAPEATALPTVADLVAGAGATDWPGLIADRIGAWAGGYFDAGQALWAAPRGRSAWSAWRAHATHDLTPEIMGLRGFAAFVADAPQDPVQAIARAAGRLDLSEAALESYFHQLLLTLGGWAQYARTALWRAELAGQGDDTLTDLLAIRLIWDEALYVGHAPALADRWQRAGRAHAAPIVPSDDDVIGEILQEAAERGAQRALAATLAQPVPAPVDARPALQAAFCIDVRSEVFRRALEAVDPSIRTLGFAGFFGIAARHRGFASDTAEDRLPVLLSPSVTSSEAGATTRAADRAARIRARAGRAWGRFKLAAVSSFAFVEAMGPVYVGRLLRAGVGAGRGSAAPAPMPRFDPPHDAAARIDAAETVLRAMSLTDGFARVVMVAGHGASVVNNPHASGLQCGACGGYSGEVNARLLAGLLNAPDVRRGLAGRGIDLPGDTLFIAALHDTTTDRVTLYAQDADCSGHHDDLARLRHWLATAGAATRAERALRLPGPAGGVGAPAARARNWAEPRPEWGLAGCQAFIAAPRACTTGRMLAGRAFLHDYDWHRDSDRDFGVLELIMTAPVVVASWISLQYYGSTVAPDTFGAGNKLLHNVVGGIGVLEGNGGPMRAGLPWQSVHDGVRHMHDPLRLSVCIAAPPEAMTAILRRHDGVRDLFDNRWLHLFALDDNGRMVQRYAGDLCWQPCPPGPG